MLEGIDEIARPLIAGSTVFANPRHEIGPMRLATAAIRSAMSRTLCHRVGRQCTVPVD